MDIKLGNRIQGWSGADLVPERYSTFPRVASFTENTTITVGPKNPTLSPQNRLPRLLFKDGAYTLRGKNIPNLTVQFVSDFWNTLLDLPWISITCFFLCSSLGFWLIFAAVFWLISYLHGDFEAHNVGNPDWTPCIYFENNSTTFVSAFLFSVETLRTIGYGTPRYPTEQCGTTIVFLCFGLILSTLLESVLVGLLLAKTHVPQQRTQTLLFSKNATICTRDEQMCLLFRIGNVRTSLLFRVVLKAFLVYAKRTDEGEDLPFHQHEIKVQIDANGDNVYLGWPITACHVIDESSPFYYLSEKNLSRAAFEIIVILEGIVESTGAAIQARTSYVPDEILWGARFSSVYQRHDKYGCPLFDFSNFDMTELQSEMKDLSAYDLNELVELSSPLPCTSFSVSPGLTPAILLSFAEEPADPICGTKEAVISPSLAKALDIPYEAIYSKSRTRRTSVNAPSRRISRYETPLEEGELRLPHPCNSTSPDGLMLPETRMRRISNMRAPLRHSASFDGALLHGSRKLSSP